MRRPLFVIAQLDRAIQYTRSSGMVGGGAYWMPAFAGMTISRSGLQFRARAT